MFGTKLLSSNTFSEPVGHILVVGNGPFWGLERGQEDLQQASIASQWEVLHTYEVFLWLIIHYYIMDDDALKSDKHTHIEQVGCTQVHKRAEIGHYGA